MLPEKYDGSRETSDTSVDCDIAPVNSGDKSNDEAKGGSLKGRKFKILMAIVYANFWMCCSYALMAPFFPAEATKKGTSVTVYGFIFGTLQFVIFISSPIFGRLLPIIGPSFMMKAGLFIAGGAVILFGLLDRCPNGIPFVSLAFACKAMEGLGDAAVLTAGYTVLVMEFPENVAKLMAVTETSFSCGLAMGPVFGGALYQLGGYMTPFATMGLLLSLGCVANFLIFKNSDAPPVQEEKRNPFKELFHWGFILDFMVIAVCFLLVGFNDATLANHLSQFNLKPVYLGFVFMIAGAMDVLSAIIWGIICDKVSDIRILSLVSCIMCTISYTIVGPVPFLHFNTQLWVVIISQIFLGLGMAGAMVCGSAHAIKDAVNRGLPNDQTTYGMISGVLVSAFALGAFAGPSIGGLLVDHLTYKPASMVMAGCQAAVTGILVITLIADCFKSSRKKEDQQGLIEDNSVSQ